jgi:hypothetical protein
MWSSGLDLFKNYTRHCFVDVKQHKSKGKAQLLDLIRSTYKLITNACPHELWQGQWPYDLIEHHRAFTFEEF